MKTLMQEVYQNFNTMSDADFKSWMLNTDLLEKEKRIVIEFALFARNIMLPDTMAMEIWYNEKYGSDEKR